jgi:toxin HigB-1
LPTTEVHDRKFSAQRPEGFFSFFENDDRSKINPEHVARIRLILSTLDQAGQVEDMRQATFRLHALKGDLKGFWAVTVRANWRIIFRFADGHAMDVDLIDYH